jgi:hypothetical protein
VSGGDAKHAGDRATLGARRALSSAAAGQDVPDDEGYDDDSNRDGDHGDCRRAHDHTVLISPPSLATLSRQSTRFLKNGRSRGAVTGYRPTP